MENDTEESTRGPDFIRQIVVDDVAAGKNGGRVQTRFPPEPNGYLHIGHAKAICIDFGVAADFGGTCYLRFDDTNPERETEEFVEGIKDDVRWLGFDWDDRLRHASDYFAEFYLCAPSSSRRARPTSSPYGRQIREYRGTLTEPGRNSPTATARSRRTCDLFEGMRARRLRRRRVRAAREDRHGVAEHQPARPDALPHPQSRASAYGRRVVHLPDVRLRAQLSDAVEGITHSLCTLEFEDHRPLYDWFLDKLWRRPSRPRQIEFSRANMMFTS